MLKEEEIFMIAEELWTNFKEETDADKDIEICEALNAAYAFNDFCNAIGNIYALGDNRFIYRDTWKKFVDKFLKQRNEVVKFIEDNDWD